MPALPFPDPPLADEAIRLRAWSLDDVDAVHEATQDPLIPRFTFVPENQTREDVLQFIESREPVRRSGAPLPLAIAERADNALLGSVSLVNFDWEQRRAALGYWVASWAREQGVATRAVGLLSRWAVTELGLARVELGTYPDNAASQRVAERCGFVREGVLRSYLKGNGRRYDIVMFSLLPKDI